MAETKYPTAEKDAYPPLMKTIDAARLLNVDRRTVTRMCESGRLRAVQIGNTWRINRDKLFEFAGLA